MEKTPFPFAKQKLAGRQKLPWSDSYAAGCSLYLARKVHDDFFAKGPTTDSATALPGRDRTHWGARVDLINGLHLKVRQDGCLLLYFAGDEYMAARAERYLR